MLLLAKFVGIAVLVWFYLTGKEQGEQPVKWAIIGVIGYWVAWWAVNISIVSILTGLVGKSAMSVFLVTQIPVIGALAVAFFIRKKLIADVAETK